MRVMIILIQLVVICKSGISYEKQTIYGHCPLAVAYALLITLFSNQVDNTEQGWVMGVTNAIMALSFGVTTFFSGFAIHYNAAMPLYLAFGGMLIAAVVLKFSKVYYPIC